MILVEMSFVAATVLALGFNPAVANWVQTHFAIMCILMLLKSALSLGKLLPVEDGEIECIEGSAAIIVIDAIRSVAVIWGMIELVGYIINGGLQNYFVGCAVLGVGGSLLIFWGEGLIYPVYSILERSDYPIVGLHCGITVEIAATIVALAACLWFFWLG